MKNMKDMKTGRTWGMRGLVAGISSFLLCRPFVVGLYGNGGDIAETREGERERRLRLRLGARLRWDGGIGGHRPPLQGGRHDDFPYASREIRVYE